jgi:hypothetical protein
LNGAVTIVDQNYIRIKGFTFANTTSICVIRVTRTGGTNKTTNPLVGIEIIDNIFNACGNNATAQSPAGDYMSRIVYFENCGHDINYSGPTVHTISGNTFTGNYGNNIQLDATSDILIELNVSTGNKGSENASSGGNFQSALVLGGGYYGWRNVIQDNEISGVTQSGSQLTEGTGIRYDTGNNDQNTIVRRNKIYDMGYSLGSWNGNRHFYGIYFEAGCGANLIANNLIYRVLENGIAIGSYQTTVNIGIKVYNNTLVDCGQVALYLHNSRNGLYKNNLVAGTPLSMVTVHSSSVSEGGHVFANNLWYKTGNSNFGLWNVSPDSQGYNAGNLNLAGWAAASGETGGVGTNPNFINAGADNFAVNAGSPAIDAGVTLSDASVAIDGTVRPVAGGYDIGCYEQ